MKSVSAWVATHAPTGTRWGKRALALLLSLVLCLTLLPGAAFAAGDTSGHWAEKTITEWQQKGYISGYSDGSFRPDSSITRAEFIKILNRVLGLTAEGSISFSDVRESDWFYAEVAKAVAAGYAQGSADGTFRPNAPVTRAEAAAMLARAFKLTENEARAAQFKDADTIPAWARGSVGAVAEAGYMTGYPDGSFGASGSITRAEAVVTADRAECAAAEDTKKPTTPGTTPGTGSGSGSSDPTPTPTPKIEIKGVKSIEPIEVETGITEENAKKSLPSEVALLGKDGKVLMNEEGTARAKIGDWKLQDGKAFDGTTKGSYTFVGTVTIPDGYTYSGTLTAEATITVKTGAQPKKITSIEFSHSIYVEEFTNFENTESGNSYSNYNIGTAAQTAVTNPTGKNKALPTTVTLTCSDGSAVEATVKDWGQFTNTTVWSFDFNVSQTVDNYTPYQLQRVLCTSDVSGLPAGYTIDENNSSFVVFVRIYVRALQRFDAFKTAYVEAKELYEKLALIENPSNVGNATDSSKIYIVPTGTTADVITKGVQFVATSEANRAYTALHTAYNSAKNYWDGTGSDHRFRSQQQCDDATAALTAAITAVNASITESSIKTGTAENDAYVAGLVKKWLENQRNAPWSKGAVLEPGSNYTLPKSNTFIEGDGLGASKIDVSLEWTLPAELQENSNDKHLEITKTPDKPKEVTLTAKLTSYRIKDGNSITSDRTVGDYTALLGAPISVYTENTDEGGITPLISGQENKNFTVQIPLMGQDEKIDTIEVGSSITATEGTNGSRFLTDSIGVTGAKPDEPYFDKNFTVFQVTVTATAKQLAAVVDTEQTETATVEFTIPHDAITLTQDAIDAGWYIPKDGLELQGKVKIWHPLVKITEAKLDDGKENVKVKFDAKYWGNGKYSETVRIALVPSTTTTVTGDPAPQSNRLVSGVEGYDKVEYNLSIPASSLTPNTAYTVWVKVGDDGAWMQSNTTYTHSAGSTTN